MQLAVVQLQKVADVSGDYFYTDGKRKHFSVRTQCGLRVSSPNLNKISHRLPFCDLDELSLSRKYM